MKTYHIKYKMFDFSETCEIDSMAENRLDAYDTAVYVLIPEKEGAMPYSAWVHSVTYNNGNYREFNTFEGKPY